MLRTIGISLFISIICLQTIDRSILHLWYELDPSSFINLFCENEARPEVHCKGKCQLMKIQEADLNGNSKEAPIPPTQEDRTQYQYVDINQAQRTDLNTLYNSHFKIEYTPQLLGRLYRARIFHPPAKGINIFPFTTG